ncbi:16S rRNA (guanine(527)-N(7))-methyltransferase RsmG [Candidatus Bodocaedibacter vickermanii]|uniref:Ribosomal RNA small subunit methyltransferase G n=1 Tax=Candidatus Bodocaedibacter vickermanii TaxID=2741701 RepID=A0A7L9RTT9_9PROT|nr:Ribosomal RNA small subunit methyltransferase G [Candidatus Paracaedibacteraceae bacterium 'Lake Konstanz']
MSYYEQYPDLNHKLDIYESLLQKWSTSLNLVAKSTLSSIRLRHFNDSLQLLPFLNKTDKIVDLGTGAGFPGMILAMCGFNVTLIDSDQKKCVFLENVSRETNTQAKIVCSRIEQFASRETFDIVCSRGVASLSTLISISKHLISKDHSIGLFLKGENVDIELSDISSDRFHKIKSPIQPNSYIIQYRY